jgi:hypothetical protein
MYCKNDVRVKLTVDICAEDINFSCRSCTIQKARADAKRIQEEYRTKTKKPTLDLPRINGLTPHMEELQNLQSQGLKRCNKCKEIRPLERFTFSPRRKGGPKSRRSYCKQCSYIRARSDLKTRERNKLYIKKYQQRPEVKARMNQNFYRRSKERAKSDPIYRLTLRLRVAVRQGIMRRGYTKRSRTAQLLGADFNTVINHLIKTAIDTYGYYTDIKDYHIDHIMPCSSATTEEELIKLQHYTNLQLLTPEDNFKKSDK